jgi:integrase
MFRRGNSKVWYFHHPVTGKKVSSGTSDKERAKLKLRDLENEAFDRRNGRYIERWEETAARWMALNQHLSNYRSQKNYDDFWARHLTGMRLSEIDEELVHNLIVTERTGRFAVNLKERVSANSTANSYVAFVAKVIRFGKVTPPAFYRYPTLKQSQKWLRPEQWHEFAAALFADLRDVCEFALATGFRIENVIGFEWDWLHGDDRAFLPREVTKTDQEYGVPFGQAARAVIARRRAAKVRHPKYVFNWNGAQWEYWQVRYYAQKQAKRLNLKWSPHTLRHTFASWLSQAGVSDTIRRRLGCWQLGGGSDAKYLHFDVEWLRPFAEKLDPLLCPVSVSTPTTGEAELADLVG